MSLFFYYPIRAKQTLLYIIHDLHHKTGCGFELSILQVSLGNYLRPFVAAVFTVPTQSVGARQCAEWYRRSKLNAAVTSRSCC